MSTLPLIDPSTAAHLTADDISAARRSEATDPKTAALLRFATEVNDHRGSVTTGQIESVRAAGASDERSPRRSGRSPSTS